MSRASACLGRRCGAASLLELRHILSGSVRFIAPLKAPAGGRQALARRNAVRGSFARRFEIAKRHDLGRFLKFFPPGTRPLAAAGLSRFVRKPLPATHRKRCVRGSARPPHRAGALAAAGATLTGHQFPSKHKLPNRQDKCAILRSGAARRALRLGARGALLPQTLQMFSICSISYSTVKR